MGLPIYLTEFTFFGGTITQKSSKFPFSAEFSDFGKTENSLESVRIPITSRLNERKLYL